MLPEHQCKLAKPTKLGGLYQFPRSLNLTGPPCEGGHILIVSPRLSNSFDDAGIANGIGSSSNGSSSAVPGASDNAAGRPGTRGKTSGAGAGGGASSGGAGAADYTRVLRLAVSMRAGPPAAVLIRAPSLGAEEFSGEIQATLLAGFKVEEGMGGGRGGTSNQERFFVLGLMGFYGLVGARGAKGRAFCDCC